METTETALSNLTAHAASSAAEDKILPFPIQVETGGEESLGKSGCQDAPCPGLISAQHSRVVHTGCLIQNEGGSVPGEFFSWP
jgi:hypothetical protein